MLRLYEIGGETGKRNKKLDEIIRLFPDDKDILAKNGNFCIERKAFIKGIELLKRAAALDPLDRTNREFLCIAYIKASLHFAKEGTTRRYREFMGNAIERIHGECHRVGRTGTGKYEPGAAISPGASGDF